MTRMQRRQKGFTFLEIMFVVVIIGILMALVGPRLIGGTNRARIQAAEAQIRNFETALGAHEVDTGTFPRRLEDLLEEENPNLRGFNGPYLDSIPLDPWGEAYIYRNPGQQNRRGFDLFSKGPDRTENTEDDIVNWRRTQ